MGNHYGSQPWWLLLYSLRLRDDISNRKIEPEPASDWESEQLEPEYVKSVRVPGLNNGSIQVPGNPGFGSG